MNETRFYFIIDDNMAITGEAITKSNITIITILYAFGQSARVNF